MSSPPSIASPTVQRLNHAVSLLILITLLIGSLPARPARTAQAAPLPAGDQQQAIMTIDPSLLDAALTPAEGQPGAPATLDPPTTLTPQATITADEGVLGVGDNFNCRLLSGGQAICWGQNDRGQSNAPSAPRFNSISAGVGYACGIKTDGTLQCWGGTSVQPPPAGTFTQLSVGDRMGCALTTSTSSVTCWNQTTNMNTMQYRGAAQQVTFSGFMLACALKTDNTVTCWQDAPFTPPMPSGAFGQISAGYYLSHYCGTRTDNTGLCMSDGQSYLAVSAGGDSGTSAFGCGIRADNTLACSGNNTYGQLNVPGGDFRFTNVAAGHRHACAVTVFGTTMCWGSNTQGQAPQISLSPASLPNGVIGDSYNTTLSASGGNGSYTYRVVQGSLPPGLSLSSVGTLAGVPTTAGNYSFRVAVTDSRSLGTERTYSMQVTTPQVEVTSTGAATEGGANGGFVITRSNAGQALTVNFSLSGAAALGSDYTLSGQNSLSGNSGTVVIPAGASSKTLTVAAIDDVLYENTEGVQLTLGGGSGYVLGMQGSATTQINDNDVPGVAFSPNTGLTTSEAGATQTVGAVLTSRPSANVTVHFSTSDGSEGTVEPASLTWTPDTWNQVQQLTLRGVDDEEADGHIIYTIVSSAAESSDPDYSGLSIADLSVTNTDNDVPGFIITPLNGLTTSEVGASATFTVRLATQPTANVVLGLTSSDTSEGSVAPASLTFTPGNWNQTQTVTVTGVDDPDADRAVSYTIVTAPATSSDPNYSGMNPADVGLTNSDDDVAGIRVTPTSGLNTSEDGTSATFSVVLTSRPQSDVSLTISSSDTGEGTADLVSLVFSPATWNQAQTVTVAGVDDQETDGPVSYTIVLAPAVSNDPDFSGVDPLDVAVTNADNDQASIRVTPAGGLVTSEDGMTATLALRLESRPDADVTVTIASSNAAEGTVTPASLTWTPTTWNQEQTVTVTGVDDAAQDGSVAYTIAIGPASSSDAAYNGVDTPDVSATNLDNEGEFRDVGNVRIWADSFVVDGATTTASGNVLVGPRVSGSGGKLYSVGEASWQNGAITVEEGLALLQGSVDLASGALTVDRTTGVVTFAPGAQVLYTRLGTSNLTVTPTLTINVLEPQVAANALIALPVPENDDATIEAEFIIGPGGVITADATAQLALNVAGGQLTADVSLSRDGLKASQAQYTLDGLGTLTISDLVVDGQGLAGLRFGADAQFPLPDINLGEGSFVMTELQGSLGVNIINGRPASLRIGLTGNLELNNLPEESSVSITGLNLKIADGLLQGELPNVALQLAGRSMTLKQVRFERRLWTTFKGLVPTASWRYEIFSKHTEFQTPSAWALPNMAAPVIIVKNVALISEAPYLRIGGAGLRFATRQPFYLAGDATAPTSVRFDQIVGQIEVPISDEMDWSVALTTSVTLKTGEQVTKLSNVLLRITNGDVRAELTDVNIPIAGATLTAPSLLYENEAFTATQVTLKFPEEMGNAVASISNLRISADGISLGGAAANFPLPDLDLGNGVLKVTQVRAALELAVPEDAPASYSLAMTGTLVIHDVSDGADVTVEQLALRFADGVLSGEIDSVTLNVAGSPMRLTELAFRPSNADNAYELTVAQASYELPAAWQPNGGPNTSVSLTGVVVRTKAPYLHIGGGGIAFDLTEPVYLAGDPTSLVVVRFDNLHGAVSYENGSWRTQFSGQLTMILSADSTVTTSIVVTLADGHVTAQLPTLDVTVGGLALHAENITYADDSFTAASAKLTLPSAWGAGALTITGLRIDRNGLSLGGAGGTFPIPDQTFGEVLRLTQMSASIHVDASRRYVITVAATATISKINSSGGNSLTVGAALTISDGRISGSLERFGFNLAGLEFLVEQPRFLSDRVTVETVGLTLPPSLGGAGITIYGMEIGGPQGFSIRGGKFKLPDFAIGTIGVQNAQAEIKRETNGSYVISAGAKLGFQAFAIEGSFTLAYTPATGSVQLRQVRLAFEGRIPTPAIPIGNTGFFITKVWGQFDLTSGTLEVEFGLNGAFAYEVKPGVGLLTATGVVKIKARPFELNSNATIRLLGIPVVSASVRITSSSFTFSGTYEMLIARATLTVAFGKDIDGEFTFYGEAAVQVGLKKGLIGCFLFLCIPPKDIIFAEADFGAGKFYHERRKVWGVRGTSSILGVDFYVFVRFSPSVGLDVGTNLNAYRPVMPAFHSNSRFAALAEENTQVFEVAITQPASSLTVMEAITDTNLLNTEPLIIEGPDGVVFTQTLTYEGKDDTEHGPFPLRTYRIDFAQPEQAVGTWAIRTASGNDVLAWGEDPAAQVTEFSVCDASNDCLPDQDTSAKREPQAVTVTDEFEIRWAAQNNEPGLEVQIYATDETGLRTLIGGNHTLDETSLSGSTRWTPALTSGVYTITMEVDDFRHVSTYVYKQPIVIDDNTAPAAPRSLTVTPRPDGSALLSWDGAAAEADIKGYRITINGTELMRVDGQFSEHEIFGLDRGREYRIALSAYDLSENMGPDATVDVTVSGLQLSANAPARSATVFNVKEAWATFTQAVDSASISVVDADGRDVGGSVTPITTQTVDGETVTVGVRLDTDAYLPEGSYTATVTGVDPVSGEPMTVSWPFEVTAEPTPVEEADRPQLFLPLMMR